nr:sulfatase-like hydrolase/transferase [Nocardioidaceae bacterium]
GVSTNSTGADPANPEGGFPAFQAAQNGTRTFAYSMNHRGNGYQTMFAGKYLNEYRPHDGDPAPPGWDVWNAVGPRGYREWGYGVTRLTPADDGRALVTKVKHRKEPADYLTEVLARNAVTRIRAAEKSSQPYLLEIAPYATHARTGGAAHRDDPLFPPAFRDRPSKRQPGGNCGTTACSKVNIEDLDGYNDSQADNWPVYPDGSATTPWHRNRRFDLERRAQFTTNYRDRARMAQSIDRLLADVRTTVGPDTYVVLTSDNGLHLGQHRLPMGKGTAYGHDVGVPLLVTGPGIRAGARDQMVSNLDLAPTFESIAGLTPTSDRDGRSLLPMLRHADAAGPRFVFFEHTRPTPAADDPDGGPGTKLVPSYIAARSKDALLVRYDLDRSPDTVDYAYEFYRGLAEPGAFEETNTYDIADPLVQEMTERLLQFSSCHEAQCRAAAR